MAKSIIANLESENSLPGPCYLQILAYDELNDLGHNRATPIF